ncbi:acyl-CoA reductase [Clostridium sardiniense]|uniref:acyl-CoA reductase n=1 Tax=Clostridium sardiniense TaxID=29369 RepID=UPI001956C087|nr:acyl-CoA reductase [Clostridium sardiniense]MBM7834600.1 hypothetical protein [Clostridium sardiniense]
MIRCYGIDGKFYCNGLEYEDFSCIEKIMKHNISELQGMPIQVMISLLDKYSKKLLISRGLADIEGVAYLSLYLKKNNLIRLIKTSLGDLEYLDKFLQVEGGKLLKAQGRGITSHWIAGNVPTLSIYSSFHSLLCRNSNILRIPKEVIKDAIRLFSLLEDIEVEYDGRIYTGVSLLKNICLVYFDSDRMDLNNKMSLISDARVIWGGERAVKEILKLQRKTTCKDLVFGPKYSFAVFDKDAIESSKNNEYFEGLVKDIIAFDQRACSSPQVVFLEKSLCSLEEVGGRLAEAFERINKRAHLTDILEGVAVKIINKRGEYGLSIDKALVCSKGLDYTILIDRDIKLEEPVGCRTIFLKEVNNVKDIVPLITPRIQCVGVAFENIEKLMEFSNMSTEKGVDRINRVGTMNIYDLPWDGSLVLNELVRWCSVNY